MADILNIQDEGIVQTTNPKGAMKIEVGCITDWSLVQSQVGPPLRYNPYKIPFGRRGFYMGPQALHMRICRTGICVYRPPVLDETLQKSDGFPVDSLDHRTGKVVFPEIVTVLPGSFHLAQSFFPEFQRVHSPRSEKEEELPDFHDGFFEGAVVLEILAIFPEGKGEILFEGAVVSLGHMSVGMEVPFQYGGEARLFRESLLCLQIPYERFVEGFEPEGFL